jgi:hypothetical protein
MTQDTSGTQDVYNYLTEAEASTLAGQVVEIVKRWQGRDNLLWQFRGAGQESVLKLYLEAGQVRADRQFSGQELFARQGLAPRPLWQERQPEGLPRPILVYEWLDGEPLDLANPLHGEALAASVATIHSSDPGEHGRFSPHPVNLAYFWRIWQASRQPLHGWLLDRGAQRFAAQAEKLWTQVEQLMAAALPFFGEMPPALIHGELMAENALLYRGQALLVDWEFFGIGDPAQEVARFLFYHSQEMDEAAQESWLQRYLAGMDDPSLEGRIALYRRLLSFHALTFLLDGLRRELSEDPAQAAELAESRQFLIETIAATFAQSRLDLLGETLGGELNELEEEIDKVLGLGD